MLSAPSNGGVRAARSKKMSQLPRSLLRRARLHPSGYLTRLIELDTFLDASHRHVNEQQLIDFTRVEFQRVSANEIPHGPPGVVGRRRELHPAAR